MNDGGEFHVALFAALVNELSKKQKPRSALRMAEILVGRITADSEAVRNHTAEAATEIAARLVRDMDPELIALLLHDIEHVTFPSRRRIAFAVPKEKRSPNFSWNFDHDEEVDAAKRAIRREFNWWWTVKKGEYWQAGFARKMMKQHPCVRRQEIVREWMREWEVESRSPRWRRSSHSAKSDSRP